MLLFVLVLLAVAPKVAPRVLLELAVRDALWAKLLVVALDLVELAEADSDSVDDADFCPPACCALVSVELNVVVSLFIFELSLVYDFSLLAV